MSRELDYKWSSQDMNWYLHFMLALHGEAQPYHVVPATGTCACCKHSGPQCDSLVLNPGLTCVRIPYGHWFKSQMLQFSSNSLFMAWERTRGQAKVLGP